MADPNILSCEMSGQVMFHVILCAFVICAKVNVFSFFLHPLFFLSSPYLLSISFFSLSSFYLSFFSLCFVFLFSVFFVFISFLCISIPLFVLSFFLLFSCLFCLFYVSVFLLFFYFSSFFFTNDLSPSTDKAFSTQHNLEVHGVVHSGNKAFVCSACGKAFARRAELRDHMRIHTGMFVTTLVCFIWPIGLMVRDPDC